MESYKLIINILILHLTLKSEIFICNKFCVLFQCVICTIFSIIYFSCSIWTFSRRIVKIQSGRSPFCGTGCTRARNENLGKVSRGIPAQLRVYRAHYLQGRGDVLWRRLRHLLRVHNLTHPFSLSFPPLLSPAAPFSFTRTSRTTLSYQPCGVPALTGRGGFSACERYAASPIKITRYANYKELRTAE